MKPDQGFTLVRKSLLAVRFPLSGWIVTAIVAGDISQEMSFSIPKALRISAASALKSLQCLD